MCWPDEKVEPTLTMWCPVASVNIKVNNKTMLGVLCSLDIMRVELISSIKMISTRIAKHV